jgi:hypothetical protein
MALMEQHMLLIVIDFWEKSIKINNDTNINLWQKLVLFKIQMCFLNTTERLKIWQHFCLKNDVQIFRGALYKLNFVLHKDAFF